MKSFLRDGMPGNNAEPERSRPQKSRRAWPLSAFCAVGAMFILNLVLGALLIETRISKPSPTQTAAPPAIELPQQNSDLKSTDQTAPVTIPAPDTARSSTPASERVPEERNSEANYSPHPKLGNYESRSAIAVERPATSSPPPAVVASILTADVAGTVKPEQPRKTITPPAISPKDPRFARKVAPVRLPGIDRGWVPKMEVGPVSPKIEIVPRPPQEKPENCGGDAYVPCPTLHTRP